MFRAKLRDLVRTNAFTARMPQKAPVTNRQLSPERRAGLLDAIADEIDQLGKDFVAIVCQ